MDDLISYLKEHSLQNVALQFSANSFFDPESLQKELSCIFPETFFFIIGETSYGKCCADEVAAKHLTVDLIIRVGDSCLTRTASVPCYFLFDRPLSLSPLAIEALDVLIESNKERKIIVLFDSRIADIPPIKHSNVVVGQTPFKPDFLITDKDTKIYDKILRNHKISDDFIIYLGPETESELLSTLALSYAAENEVIKLDILTGSSEKVGAETKILFRKFQTIQRMKESQVFGILISSLSMENLNVIIESIKVTLKENKKKYYTFLLGKLTDEKIATYSEHIDCFVLVSCQRTASLYSKLVEIPVGTPLDLKLAFDDRFEWGAKYSFEPSRSLIEQKRTLDEIKLEEKEEVSNLLAKCNENTALSKVFDGTVMESYEKRVYKGLDKNVKVPVEKFKIGKKGIPIKYDNIQ